MSADKNWYALRTATRQEKRAMDALAEAKIETYQPLLTRFVGTKVVDDEGEREKVKRPLLDGYVFMWGNLEDVDTAKGLDGVHAAIEYLADSGRLYPMPIPHREIASLMIRERDGEFDLTTRQRFRPGKNERVRITKGLFVGYVGEVIAMTPDERRVTLQLATGRAEIRVDHIEAVA